MKKCLIAMAALGWQAGAVHAQSVTISGYLDASVLLESGAKAGSVKKLGSGVSGPNRLVFSGREDLGGGMSAFFHLENGNLLDTGGSLQGGFFGRQAYVGMSGGFGTVRLGNMFQSMFATLVFYGDPCLNSFACGASNLMTAAAGAGPNANGVISTGPGATSGATLVNPTNGGAPGANAGSNRANMVSYTTPNMGGFEADLQYAFGESSVDSDRSRTISVGARYRSGPVVVAANYLDTNDINGSPDRSTLLAGSYDFGVAKVHAALGNNRYAGTLGAAKKNRDMLVGVSAPLGLGRLMASYVEKDDRLAANRDASQLGLAYAYSLSKRTILHASMGRIKNKNGATYGLGTPAGPATPNPFAGTSSRVCAIGIGHAF